MNWLLSGNWVLISSIWYFGNGILHDVFVLINHKGKYDRELLRLLMDGHVLLLSGAITFTGWVMINNAIAYADILNGIIALFMILYCMMIFPFLKSFGTLLVSILLLLVSIF